LPRLFTGLELPAAIAAELTLLRGGIAGARWLDAANFHVTLRFIGDIDDRVAREVAEVLGEIRRPSFPVAVEGPGWFGADRPRAIIARIKPTAPLLDLQAEQERLLRRIGLAPETRKFTPHVTLARLRAPSPHAVADYLGLRSDFPALRFEATRFVLFAARESTGGGPYLVAAAYDLIEPQRPWT
jgi:2'-5' RNA ligase